MNLKESPEYKNLPFRGQWAIDNIIEYTKEIKAQNDKLEKQVESLSNFQPVQKLKEYFPQPKVWEDEKDEWGYTKKNTNGWNIQKPVVSVENLQEWLGKNEPIYQENIQICENNKKAKEAAFKFINKLGLQRTKYDYTSSRSKKKSEVTCQWTIELESLFAVSCEYSWKNNQDWVRDETKKINDYHQKKKDEEESIKKQEASKLKEQEKTAQIIRLVEKYKLQFDIPIPSVYEVAEQLAKKNKYLYLARYLAKNRGDWNDGSSYAETGLNYFISQKEEIKGISDSEIYDNIQSYISNWDGDGRVFRDCEWNYDRLFNIVQVNQPELYKDYCKLVENGEE